MRKHRGEKDGTIDGMRPYDPQRGPLHALSGPLGADWRIAYLLVAPAVIYLGSLVAYPFLRALYISFTDTKDAQIGTFVGFQNYQKLWRDRFFRESVAVTIKFTASSVAAKLLASMLAATLLHHLESEAGFCKSLMLLPWMMPQIVQAITWRGLLDPLHGGINSLLLNLGVVEQAIPFLGSVQTALPSVILVDVWRGVPFFVINLLAAIETIDPTLYEAAAIDGAGPFRRFLNITLPGVRHVIYVVTLLSTIWTFNSFKLIFLLTSGGPMNTTKVYSVLSYFYAVGGHRLGLGIAVAMSMAPVFGTIIFILGRHLSGHAGRTSAQSSQRASGPFKAFKRAWACALRPLIRLVEKVEKNTTRLIERITIPFAGIPRPRGLAKRVPELLLRRSRRLLSIATLIALLLFELLPFYWVVVTAFKTELQITQFRSVLWPNPWSLEQFRALLGPRRSFMIWLKNTIFISALTALLSTLLASLAAYAATRLRWKGAKAFSSAVLVSYLMPSVIIVIPIYQLFARLGLTNSLSSLVLSYPTFILPLAIWLMMSHYTSIPRELEEAAMIDGCNRLQTFARLILPLTRSALVAVGLFAITQAWNEFLYAYTFIASESKMPIPLGLAQMIFGDILPWGELCAATLIMAIPTLALFSVGQRFLVAGLTAGAVKG